MADVMKNIFDLAYGEAKRLHSITTKSKEIVSEMKNIFDLAKQEAKKLDKN